MQIEKEAERKTYYHINHKNLNVGDTIKAGSMGEIIRNNYILHDTNTQQPLVWRMFQEQTFELIRINEFPLKPSRYKSIYLFTSLEDAQKFIDQDKRDGTNIYSVKLLDESKEVHAASMKLYERIPLNRPTFPAIEEQARQYWKGVNNIDPVSEFKAELLTESDVIVIETIKGNE